MKAAHAKLCDRMGNEITQREEVVRVNWPSLLADQCTGPVGVVFANCSTASVIRRQVATPSRSPSVSRLPARVALSLGALSPKRLSITSAARQMSISGITGRKLSVRDPGKISHCRRHAGEGALRGILPGGRRSDFAAGTSVNRLPPTAPASSNRGAVGSRRIPTAPMRRRLRSSPEPAGRSARSVSRAFWPCRRGWRRCRSRGRRRRRSAAPQAYGRCA